MPSPPPSHVSESPAPDRDFLPSPSASPRSTPAPDTSPEPAESPVPPSTRDSRSPATADQPYVTHSGHSSRPMRKWWKVDHPYQHAREQHNWNRRSGTPESACEAAVIALEDANGLCTLSDSELIEYAFLTSGAELCSYKEAMKRDDAGLWHKASQDEYNALHEYGVWELCELPLG